VPPVLDFPQIWSVSNSSFEDMPPLVSSSNFPVDDVVLELAPSDFCVMNAMNITWKSVSYVTGGGVMDAGLWGLENMS